MRNLEIGTVAVRNASHLGILAEWKERKEKEESMAFIERRQGGSEEGKGKSVVFE